LFEPDEYGHKFIRFYHNEVTPVECLQPIECLYPDEVEPVQAEVELPEKTEKVEVEPEPEQVEPAKPPIHMLVRMTDELKGYSFKQGEVFAASETGSGYNACYYIYDPFTFKQRGCVVKEVFELLYKDLSVSQITEKASLREFVKKAIEKPKQPKNSDLQAKPEEKPIKAKVKKRNTLYRALEEAGQMNIFDLL
jgi:hypothetical protein